MKIGKAIKKLRRRGHEKQRQLAEGIGTTQPYISAIEGGKIAPSAKMLNDIAKHYNIDYVDLLLMAR